MPYLRITARTIPIDVRRQLVNELTAATLRLMPSEHASLTSVHFTDIDPERFATESRLIVDGQTPNVQLEFIAPHIPERTRHHLIDRLTGILMNAYKMHGEDIYHVYIKFTSYDAARDFAIGGRFAGRFISFRSRVTKSAPAAIGALAVIGAAAYFATRFLRETLPSPRTHAGEIREANRYDRDSQLPQAILED